MTRGQRGKQYRGERDETEAVQERIEEYTQSKIQKAIDMVRRAWTIILCSLKPITCNSQKLSGLEFDTLNYSYYK